MIQPVGGRLVVGALGVIGAATTVVLGQRSTHTEITALESLTLAGVGVAFVAAGLVATARRPGNVFGWLLVGVGLAVHVWTLTLANAPVVYTTGRALSLVWFALLIHVLAVYPTGRFDSALAGLFAVGGYLCGVVLQPAMMLFTPAAAAGRPENLLAVAPNESVVTAIVTLQTFIGAVVMILAVAVLVRRWRRSSAVQRRSLTPILGAGGLVIVILVAGAVGLRLTGRLPPGQGWLLVLSLLAVPSALLIGFLRARMSHTRVSELAIRLASGSVGPEELRHAIATAVEDPSLVVAYWAPNLARYVTSQGEELDLSDHDGRARRTIEQGGRRVAALLFDPALDDDPELLDAVSATAGLALDNEHLRADLRAQLADLRASRSRLAAAEDTERRRLERNLHDGAQQRLIALGLALQMVRARLGDEGDADEFLNEAEDELRSALRELRELAQGLHPAILTEGGLKPAVAALADRCPLPVRVGDVPDERFPETVEATAYFVVSEALANVAKHADATSAAVSVATGGPGLTVVVSDDGRGGADPGAGSGLVGLADRVGATGGQLRVDSPSGAGTTVEAVIPCGS